MGYKYSIFTGSPGLICAFKCLTVAAKKARTINDLHEIGISNNHMLSELWYFTSVHSLALAYLSKPSIKYPI